MADDPKEVAEWEKIFKKFDTDGNGKISEAELGEALKSTGGSCSAEDVKSTMAKVDSDGDGFISFEEFTTFVKGNKDIRDRILQASSS